ncbi:MAG TPA: hypothetical protein VLC46_09515 [Thermoanaerobaculia bacterium]|jgi:hypothetical protein|nr:hypothetical protein [Thermoanaerobaculia bacterium]
MNATGIFRATSTQRSYRMLRRSILRLALVAAPLLTGCVNFYHVHPGTLPVSSASIPPDQKDAVWKRAVVVLLDQGYVPQILNHDAYYISAKRREDIDNDAFAGTIALFSITADGQVRVEVSGGGLFHSEQQFIAAVGQRQDELLRLILNSPGGR